MEAGSASGHAPPANQKSCRHGRVGGKWSRGGAWQVEERKRWLWQLAAHGTSVRASQPHRRLQICTGRPHRQGPQAGLPSNRHPPRPPSTGVTHRVPCCRVSQALLPLQHAGGQQHAQPQHGGGDGRDAQRIARHPQAHRRSLQQRMRTKGRGVRCSMGTPPGRARQHGQHGERGQCRRVMRTGKHTSRPWRCPQVPRPQAGYEARAGGVQPSGIRAMQSAGAAPPLGFTATVLGSRGKGGQGAHHCSKHDLLIARHGTHLLEPLAGQLQGGKQEAGRQRVRQGGTQPADGRGSSEGAVLSCQSRPSMPGWGTPGQDLSTSLRHRTRRPCSLGMLQRSCVQINVPGRICTCGASGVSLISGANSLYMMSGVMSRPARAGTTEACEARARTGGEGKGSRAGRTQPRGGKGVCPAVC